PKMTVGGYLIREHRLQALRGTLSNSERQRLSIAIERFQNTMTEWTVRAETKVYREVDSRLKQWEEVIRDLRRRPKENWTYFSTSVEARVMLNELLEMLAHPPFNFDETYIERLDKLDGGFRGMWRHKGDLFIWDEGWQAAYPARTFWYLYGEPVRRDL
ncbi:MAG: hypothetical protein AAF633_25040, partial [Chloroflexota bacterium]